MKLRINPADTAAFMHRPPVCVCVCLSVFGSLGDSLWGKMNLSAHCGELYSIHLCVVCRFKPTNTHPAVFSVFPELHQISLTDDTAVHLFIGVGYCLCSGGFMPFFVASRHVDTSGPSLAFTAQPLTSGGTIFTALGLNQ